VAREQRAEPLPQLGDRRLVDETLVDNEEAVVLEGGALVLVPGLDRQLLGLRFSGS
jgi:hypothetical protein